MVDSANKLLGTFTDGDLRRQLQNKGAAVLEMPVKDLMTSGCRTTAADAKAVDAMHAMENPTKVTFLPVTDPATGVLEGLVTLHGLVSAGL